MARSICAGISSSTAMIADLRRGNLDWIDQVPFTAVNAVKKTKGVKVNQWPGGEITNITGNANPRKPKNREPRNSETHYGSAGKRDH